MLKFSGYTTEALIISSSTSAEERFAVSLKEAALSNSEKVISLKTISKPFYSYLKYRTISIF
jgi:hypothetical protein